MSQYFVSPAGDDANSGSEQSPFLTINHALSVVAPGNEIVVMHGEYRETFENSAPSGESWDKPITIRAYDGHRPTLKPQEGAYRVFTLDNYSGQPVHHIIIDGFVMDAVNVGYDAVKITGGSHHIRVTSCEIKNAIDGHGILVSGSGGQNEFLGLRVHNCGVSGLDHGIYLKTPANLIDRCYIHDNYGHGVHVYENQTTDYNVTRNSWVWGNQLGIGMYGVSVGQKAYNNIVFGNGLGIRAGYGTDGALIAHNVVYDNDAGIRVNHGGTDRAHIINNILFKNSNYGIEFLNGPTNGFVYNNLVSGADDPDRNISDPDSVALLEDNLIGNEYDPLFRYPDMLDFRLYGISVAIRAGRPIRSITTDINGNLRDGERPAMGAYED